MGEVQLGKLVIQCLQVVALGVAASHSLDQVRPGRIRLNQVLHAPELLLDEVRAEGGRVGNSGVGFTADRGATEADADVGQDEDREPREQQEDRHQPARRQPTQTAREDPHEPSAPAFSRRRRIAEVTRLTRSRGANGFTM